MVELERLDVAVVGAGVVGLAMARAFALARPRRGGARSRIGARHAHELPQLRGHPRRDLLPDRVGEGAPLRRGQAEALRLLPRGRRGACARRQDDRGQRATKRSPRSRRSRRKPKPTACTISPGSTGPRRASSSRKFRAFAASFRPSTGIVDSHGLMAALRADATRAGAQLLLSTPVVGGRAHDDGVVLSVGGAEPITVSVAPSSIRPAFARKNSPTASQGMPKERIPGCFYAKGHYFVLGGARAVPPPGLSGARARRPRRSRHARPRRPGAFRSRRLLGRRHRLRFRRKPSGFFLRRHPHVLSSSARRRPPARLHRHPSQARPRGNARARLRRAVTTRPRRGRGSSTFSASSRPASPRRSRWRPRSANWRAPDQGRGGGGTSGTWRRRS